MNHNTIAPFIELLQQLIAIPSFSREEQGTATHLMQWLQRHQVRAQRSGNNIWAVNLHFDPAKPTILLNSHHDTVKPANAYVRNPFNPEIADGRLYGLGSNDAGGALVALTATFLSFYREAGLPFNLLLALTAEEEISGANGIVSLLPLIGKIDCALVGEPTELKMAVAERGLMVLDVTACGKAGHAARNEGENAIYKAMQDIGWFRSYFFEKESGLLGPVTMNVTAIETTNKAHNVIPDSCRFVVDVRLNEQYTHEEVLEVIKAHVHSEVLPRSMRLRSSMISLSHPLVKAGMEIGLSCYGSPTLSDKALMPFPALKVGPGSSLRSHIADEFIYVEEIEQAAAIYRDLLQGAYR